MENPDIEQARREYSSISLNDALERLSRMSEKDRAVVLRKLQLNSAVAGRLQQRLKDRDR